MGYAYFCNRCESLFGDDDDPPRAFEAEVPEWFIENTTEGAEFVRFNGERIDLCVDCTHAILVEGIEEYDPTTAGGQDSSGE